MRRTFATTLALASLVALTGCGANQASVIQNEQFNDGGLVAIQGINATGEYLNVDGEWVMMFGYADDAAAEADQNAIAADGKSINGQPLNWAGPVHFFRRGRFIAIYVGSQLSVLEKLKGEGEQFAGD
jgi:hypothetical protein